MQKYLTIYHELADKIKEGTWEVDDLLPSENDLADHYGTSRETIRKALNVLVQNGLIQKIRGKGSVIIDSDKFDFPVSGIRSFKELADTMHLEASTIVKELSLEQADSQLQRKLQLHEAADVWKVTRVRQIADEKVILDKDFLLEKTVPGLTEDICKHSIYHYIENELGLVIGFGHKEIVVEEATEDDYDLLHMDNHMNVVVIRSVVYLDDAQAFQYTESRHRPDKFRFVDFARRTPN